MGNLKMKVAGQPPRYGKAMKRVQIFLTEEQKRKAKEIGGTVSRGIQILLEKALAK